MLSANNTALRSVLGMYNRLFPPSTCPLASVEEVKCVTVQSSACSEGERREASYKVYTTNLPSAGSVKNLCYE